MEDLNLHGKKEVTRYILNLLSGPIKPIGDTTYDTLCMENLEKWKDILNIAIEEIYEAYIKGKNSFYQSEKELSKEAKKILYNSIIDLVDELDMK